VFLHNAQPKGVLAQRFTYDSGAKTPKQLTHTSTQKLFDNKKWYFIGDIAHYSVPKTIVPLRFSWLFH